LAEKTRDQDFQLKVSGDGRTNLQFIIDNLVRDIKAQRDAHEDCQGELQQQRRNFRALERRHDGLQRQFVNYQITVARTIPLGERSPEVNAMLAHLEALAAEPPPDYPDEPEAEPAPDPTPGA
jgi:hypothetical protein